MKTLTYQRIQKLNELCGGGGVSSYRQDCISKEISEIAFEIQSANRFDVNTCAKYLMPYQSSIIMIDLSYSHYSTDKYIIKLTISYLNNIKIPQNLMDIIRRNKLNLS